MGSSYFSSFIFWAIQLAAAYFCYQDLQKYSDDACESAGTPKQTALIIIIVGGVCCWIALIYYWFALKPKFEAAQTGGAGGYPPAA